MSEIEIEGKRYSYHQRVIELPEIDLITWLSKRDIFPKVFWKERESSTSYAAVSSLLSFEEAPDLSSCSADVRLYGGMRFDPTAEKDPLWDAFPDKKFWLPRWEIIQGNGSTKLVIHSTGEEGEVLWEEFLRDSDGIEDDVFFSEKGVGNFEAWKNSVESILRKIETSSLQKVVLAKKTTLEAERLFCGWDVLKKLRAKTIRTTLFGFEIEPGSVFIGASPEKLFSRAGQFVQADAVAGTRPRGKTEEEDASIQEDLLHHPKDLNEFFIVKQFLESALSDSAEEWNWLGPDQVLKNTHVQHLYNRLDVQLKAGIKDRELIEKLHPTPALGGFPKEQALSCIRQYESFDRGWYGAPIGRLSPGGAYFAVGIRSALIKDNEIHLFSGAGIVPGSDPLEEWKEIHQKIKPFLSLLQMEVNVLG